jgi:beta-glucanase (GH16 family)
MKTNSLMLLFGILSITACKKDGNDNNPGKPAEVTITFSQTAIDVPTKGGTYTVDVTTTGDKWSATSSIDWVTANTTGSSTPKGTLFIVVQPNQGDSRSASVLVSSGTKTEKITIEQAAALRVSKSEIMTKSGGETYPLTISGYTDWTATSNASWITASRVSGGLLSIVTAPSTETKTRSGEVTIATGDKSLVVTVYQESAEITDIPARDGYTLVWHDEFNQGSELNKADWTHEVQNAGWVNNELQNYVDGAYNGQRVTELSDGKLRIHCFKSGGNVYSGRVYAHVSEGWQYGYMEARIMLPKGKGTWPAFWMMPANNDFSVNPWPKCGEIDIMEEVGVVPNEVSSSLHAQGHNHTNGTQVTHAMTIAKAEGEFHTYGIEWTAQKITTYVDGNVQLVYNNDGSGVVNWPYDKPFYIIFNLAWGGSWGGMYGVDESALPLSLVVDYVRVYQQKK